MKKVTYFLLVYMELVFGLPMLRNFDIWGERNSTSDNLVAELAANISRFPRGWYFFFDLPV
jgi:hypothetical protein